MLMLCCLPRNHKLAIHILKIRKKNNFSVCMHSKNWLLGYCVWTQANLALSMAYIDTDSGGNTGGMEHGETV